MRHLQIKDIAKRLKRAPDTIYRLSRGSDFPPPRRVIGNVKLFAWEDVEFWQRHRRDGRKHNGRKNARRA